MKDVRVLASLLLLGAAATAAAADNGFYFGATGGESSYDFDPIPVNAIATIGPFFSFPPLVAAAPGAPVPSAPVPSAGWGGDFTFLDPPFRAHAFEPARTFWIPGNDEEATTWSVLAGYRFLRHAAVELAYHDMGTLHEYSPARDFGQFRSLEVKSEMATTAATLSLLGQLPITDQWSVYVRAGGVFADQDVSHRIGGSRKIDDSYDSEVFLYGIGTQLDFGTHWTVRLDFQRYDDVGKGNGIGQADVDALTLGVLFRLGGN